MTKQDKIGVAMFNDTKRKVNHKKSIKRMNKIIKDNRSLEGKLKQEFEKEFGNALSVVEANMIFDWIELKISEAYKKGWKDRFISILEDRFND